MIDIGVNYTCFPCIAKHYHNHVCVDVWTVSGIFAELHYVPFEPQCRYSAL